MGVLALTKSNNVILVRQFRPGTEEVYDEIPDGIIEKGETPNMCAERELMDETGYTGDIEYIDSCVDCDYRAVIRHCFFANNCRKVEGLNNDKNEFIEVTEKPLDEFIEQVRSGELTGA